MSRNELNDVMEFDHVVEVHKDGTVTDCDIHGYFYLSVDSEGNDHFDMSAGWELLTGFTGQYSYNGPVMHSSEFIGGGLEKHIRETPGYYVALVVEATGEHEWQYARLTGNKSCAQCGLFPIDEYDEQSECRREEPAGWAVAYKRSNESD